MKVCLDARFVDGAYGGVQGAAAALIDALVRADSGVELALLVYRGHTDWLSEAARQLELVPVEPPPTTRPRAPLLPAVLRNAAPALRIPDVPQGDGTLEAIGADAVHFTYQNGFRTPVPSVYQPWDLQHVHLPSFFTRRERALRDRWYRALAEQAAAVVVATEWARRDVVTHLGVELDRVHVVPAGPAPFVAAAATEAALTDVRARVGDAPFALYPASTHAHKNHLRLVEAVGDLRDRGSDIRVVCVGRETPHAHVIRRRIRNLRLGERVLLLGHVDDPTLRALYSLARCLVFPSLFEGWGLPVTEAFALGVPVACSAATSLPDLVGDAAVLFDPSDTDAVAAAIERVWTEPELRAALTRRGRERAALYTWDAAASRFLQLYAAVGA